MTRPENTILQQESKQDEHPQGENPQDADSAKQAEHDTDSSAGHDDPQSHSEASGDVDPMKHYLAPGRLIHHVQDAHYFEFPSLTLSEADTIKVAIPSFGLSEENAIIKVPENDYIAPVTFRPTKFMVLELVGALVVAGLFIYLARQIKDGQRAKGRLANMLEALVLFVRDDIARPAIGKKDATRYLPFIWTIFFFILTLNLFGMIPFMGAATGSLGCTAALALITFAVVLGAGMKKLGVVGFWKAQAPHIDLPGPMKVTLIPVIWGIEVFGLFIKHMVLAVRLFANMFAGHLVLAAFVAFIGVTWNSWLAIGVVPASIGASVMISLLELLVALIQAYVFAFLAALFIGAAIHPH